MGFEDNKDALGFEGEQLDLDSDADLTMGTGTAVRAQRKKGIKTEEVAFAKPKRDRFGRRGDGEEAGEGADMLNPDKPTRIAGGFSRREMTPQEVKPLHSENSKFGYLFSADEEDEDEVSTVQGKKSAVDALAMKGDEANAGNVFERETRSVIHSQGKPQRRREDTEEAKKPVENTSRFSRRSESNEQKQQNTSGPRFARRSSTIKEAPAEPVKEEPTVKAEPVIEAPVISEPVKTETAASVTEPVVEPITEDSAQEQTADSAVYADSQIYGYGNPYAYGQYQQPYSPYGGYPPQNPYMQPYGQPYNPYGQTPYPYQYPPMGYAQPQPQPQYIPVGYVFQAGFVPVELAHNTPQRRKRRPSAARSAYRYDQAPYEEYEEEQPVQVQKVRAIAAKSEPAPEQPAPMPETAPAPIPVQEEKKEEKTVVIETVKEEKPAYESQYERIVSEIPQRPAVEEKPAVIEESVFTEEIITEEKPESNVPSRFARRGTSQPAQTQSQPERYIGESTGHSRFAARGSAQPAQNESPAGNASQSSRFAARGSASRSTQPSFESPMNDSASGAPSGGGRFNRRG